jgi:hypothetical protein
MLAEWRNQFEWNHLVNEAAPQGTTFDMLWLLPSHFRYVIPHAQIDGSLLTTDQKKLLPHLGSSKPLFVLFKVSNGSCDWLRFPPRFCRDSPLAASPFSLRHPHKSIPAPTA